MQKKDLVTALERRSSMLEARKDGVSAEYEMKEGDWGLITVREGERLLGFEFLESENSWKRPDALLQYAEIASEGYYVGVIVPSSIVDNIERLILGLGEVPVELMTYDVLGITEEMLSAA